MSSSIGSRGPRVALLAAAATLLATTLSAAR